MDFQELQNLGAFVDSRPQMRKVKIGENEVEVGVECLGFAETLKLRGEKPPEEYCPAFIARCIHFDGGKKMTEAQARALTPEAAQAFLAVIREVNEGPKAS